MTPAFEELDKSIEESKRSAEIFLNAVWTIGWIAALAVAIYIVPEVAEQKLSTISNARSEAQAEYRDQVRAYERKFGKKFEPISHDECEARKKKGITDEISLANCAIRYDRTYQTIENIAKMVAHFRVQDSKMESIFKLLPILLGTVFGALLLTYRSHAKATDQFRNKKIEAQLKREEST